MNLDFNKIVTNRGYSQTEPHIVWYVVEDISEIESKVTFSDPVRCICGEILMEYHGDEDDVLNQYDVGNYVDISSSHPMVMILDIIAANDLLD